MLITIHILINRLMATCDGKDLTKKKIFSSLSLQLFLSPLDLFHGAWYFLLPLLCYFFQPPGQVFIFLSNAMCSTPSRPHLLSLEKSAVTDYPVDVSQPISLLSLIFLRCSLLRSFQPLWLLIFFPREAHLYATQL
jgi:hypothetical protein